MDHPAREIPHVIESLTMGSPQEQEDTLNAYFLSNASFTHPFCRVPSFSKGVVPFARGADSRWLILGIYRWYRTLSPHIDLKVDSAVFDQHTGVLYVSMHQTFSIWFVPFYKAPVRLVTLLQLIHRSSAEVDQMATKNHLPDGQGGSESPEERQQQQQQQQQQGRARYFIASQEDMYQANECFQLVVPYLGPWLWFVWQLFSTGLCVGGSLIFLPLYYVMNRKIEEEEEGEEKKAE